MLGILFRGLTAKKPGAAALFDSLTREARLPHWYVEGKVPDTLDGRFAVLATVIALVLVRLESEGEMGDRISVALTERFIHVMESEHRELGLGDPTLGKTVRKLVGMLARRTELWRAACAGETDSFEATGESLYKDEVTLAALGHSAKALNELKMRVGAASLADLEQGVLA
jgi:cytochrome b pre-mRNA-processing protein 3